MSRSGATGDPAERARQHFDRAVQLAGSKQAGLFVTFAEAVCVEKQNVKQFEELLGQALLINADAYPELRLANLIMQRRARWLLSKKEDLFLLPARSPSN
jgi:predicted anti-sigma-YlaC factor YlaD